MAESAFIVPVPEAEPHAAHLRERYDPVALLGVPAQVTLLFGVSAACHAIALIENSSGRRKPMHVLPLSATARSSSDSARSPGA